MVNSSMNNNCIHFNLLLGFKKGQTMLNKKTLISGLVIAVMSLSSVGNAFANDEIMASNSDEIITEISTNNDDDYTDRNAESNSQDSANLNLKEENINPTYYAPPRVRVLNVRSYETWGPAVRVSNSLTGPGSISCSITKTFGVSTSGSVGGVGAELGVNMHATISSSIGYTLNVPSGYTGYMAFRARYKVITGIRESYDPGTGKIYERNNFTIKQPIYGHHFLA